MVYFIMVFFPDLLTRHFFFFFFFFLSVFICNLIFCFFSITLCGRGEIYLGDGAGY